MQLGRVRIAGEGQPLFAKGDAKTVLHEDQQADRGNHGDVRRVGEERRVQEAIDADAENRRRPHGGNHAEANRTGCVRHNEGDVRAEGIDRGVGDMQDAKQAVDEREADGHQRIHAAEDKPVERQVDIIQLSLTPSEEPTA